MQPFFQGAWAVAARNLRVWRTMALASVLGNFGEPILYLLAMGFGLGRVVPPLDGMTYAEFIAPGLVVSTVMYTATFEMTYGSYTRMAEQGVWDAILATPVTPTELCMGELIYAGVKAGVGAVAVLLVVAAFGLVQSPLAVFVLPLGFVAGVLFASMALAVTTVSKSYEAFNYYFTLVVAPMFLFSGIFFPLEGSPRWLKLFAQVLPLTHVVQVSRACLRGTFDGTAAVHVAVVLAMTCGGVALAAAGARRRLNH